MDRDVPYDPQEICDNCGAKGAFDFMGDLICPDCLKKANELKEYLTDHD